jgi:hypothetical protein
MKKQLALSAILTLALTGILSIYKFSSANNVTDVCTGVSTVFNATVPSEVTQGQTFSITGLFTQPAATYGVTVTSSTLALSATGATPSTYAQTDSSTNPSPTTGAPTYETYYPNWSLTASGSAGSQIVVKLGSIAAQVSGVGTINCNLSAILATINIEAPPTPVVSPAKPSSTTPSSTTPTTTKPITPTGTTPTNTTTPTTPTSTTTPTSAPTTKHVTRTVVLGSSQEVTITVKNSGGQTIQGAQVSVDSSSAVYSDSKGNATFKNLTSGSHHVTVSFNNRKVSQTIELGSKNDSDIIPIKVPSNSSFKLSLIYTLPPLLVLIGVGGTFIYLRFKKDHIVAPAAQASPSSGIALEQSEQVITPAPTVMPTASSQPPAEVTQPPTNLTETKAPPAPPDTESPPEQQN